MLPRLHVPGFDCFRPDGYRGIALRPAKFGELFVFLYEVGCNQPVHKQDRHDDKRIVLVLEKIEPPFVWPAWIKSKTWAAQNVKGIWFFSAKEPYWADHGNKGLGGWCSDGKYKLRMDSGVTEDIKFPERSVKESKMQKP